MNPKVGKEMQLEIKLHNFRKEDVLKDAILDSDSNLLNNVSNQSHFVTKAVLDTLTGRYYLLVVFKSLIMVQEDICFNIKSLQTPQKIMPFKFSYWLSPKFVV